MERDWEKVSQKAFEEFVNGYNGEMKIEVADALPSGKRMKFHDGNVHRCPGTRTAIYMIDFCADGKVVYWVSKIYLDHGYTGAFCQHCEDTPAVQIDMEKLVESLDASFTESMYDDCFKIQTKGAATLP